MLGSIAVTNLGVLLSKIEDMQPYSAEKLAKPLKRQLLFKQKSSKPEPNNDLSQLKDLKQLLDEGIITEEEFMAEETDFRNIIFVQITEDVKS